jgi:hypothetical protein
VSLLELQRRMAEDVRRPLTGDFTMQPATEGGESTEQIVSRYIKPNATLTSFERLEIYNRQYWFRVIEVVSEDYPALSSVVGPRRFDALILAYLRENPSTSFSLRNLGRNLPAWLDRHPEFAGTRHRLAVDVARLEWAYVEAFDGAVLPPVSAAEAAHILPSAVLALQPHLQLLELSYPVDEIVLAVHRKTAAADIVSNAATPRKRSGRGRLPQLRRSQTRLAVHRHNDWVYYRRLDPESFRLLSAIQKGRTLEAAITIALTGSNENPEQQAARIRECFGHASELGWIVARESVQD